MQVSSLVVLDKEVQKKKNMGPTYCNPARLLRRNSPERCCTDRPGVCTAYPCTEIRHLGNLRERKRSVSFDRGRKRVVVVVITTSRTLTRGLMGQQKESGRKKNKEPHDDESQWRALLHTPKSCPVLYSSFTHWRCAWRSPAPPLRFSRRNGSDLYVDQRWRTREGGQFMWRDVRERRKRQKALGILMAHKIRREKLPTLLLLTSFHRLTHDSIIH